MGAATLIPAVRVMIVPMSTRASIAFIALGWLFSKGASRSPCIYQLAPGHCRLPARQFSAFKGQRTVRTNRLGLAELAAEVVQARDDSGQPRQTFQNGFVPQRLKFFTQFVGDLPKRALEKQKFGKQKAEIEQIKS